MDSPATFVAADRHGRAPTAPSRIDAGGHWTYTANSAHDEFVAGTTYTDTFTVDRVPTARPRTVTVNILGTNDAAVLSSATVNLTETQRRADHRRHADDQRRGQPGDLRAAGRHGRAPTAPSRSTPAGTGATPPTRPTTSSSVGRPTPTPSRSTAADGTTTTVTINILGTNDAAVLSSATVNLTETNAAADHGGTLTISDVDSPATFVAAGTAWRAPTARFTIDAGGHWTYTANSAYDEFVGGTTYTDTFTVTRPTARRPPYGQHPGHQRRGGDLLGHGEPDRDAMPPLTTGGTLTISDVDSPTTFVAADGRGGHLRHASSSTRPASGPTPPTRRTTS